MLFDQEEIRIVKGAPHLVAIKVQDLISPCPQYYVLSCVIKAFSHSTDITLNVRGTLIVIL